MQPSIHRLQTRAVEAGTFPSMMGGWDDPERCGVETAVCGDQMVRARNGCHDNLPARAAQPTVVYKVAPAISRRGLGRAHRPQPPAASCPGPNTAAPDSADSGAACRVGAPPHPAYAIPRCGGERNPGVAPARATGCARAQHDRTGTPAPSCATAASAAPRRWSAVSLAAGDAARRSAADRLRGAAVSAWTARHHPVLFDSHHRDCGTRGRGRRRCVTRQPTRSASIL